MRSTSTTEKISYGALALFGIYALFSLGTSGLMFSIAVGLIVFSVVDSVEIATAIVILFGLLYKYLTSRRAVVAVPSTEGFSTDDLQTVAKRVQKIRIPAPVATYASPFVEGFADADSATNGSAQGEQKANDASSATTKPAETETKEEDVKEKPKTNEKFADQTNGLFKLGEIPTESKGGPHIDQGTTLMTAIGSLKPQQIQAMTEDTRKLLDTQKNLMSMLATMKPMLNDGKQLMDTFQNMFGDGKNPGVVA